MLSADVTHLFSSYYCCLALLKSVLDLEVTLVVFFGFSSSLVATFFLRLLTGGHLSERSVVDSHPPGGPLVAGQC